MKKPISLLAFFIVCIVILAFRVTHISSGTKQELKVTDWDCLGYYMFLPATFIYHDVGQLNWMPGIEAKYNMIGGGGFYQAGKAAKGNYVGKYLLGVAIMQAPFFLAGHCVAILCGYPADGFSQPYQWAVAWAALFYGLLGIFLLRKLLLHYFSDVSVAITILLLSLATNYVQYVAVNSGMSHVYIFVLYALVLLSTKKWHDEPGIIWAALTGFIIGLAAICRPTEAVMLFIPLMWGTQNKEAADAKWELVSNNKRHILIAAMFGTLGVLPQLLYWKIESGSWLYDVGSAWDFLNPHLQVLFGWEKGWFIYTPVTLFFIIGMFFIKRFPFRVSVLWFCVLNLYIIISWREWQYAGSYSARAIMQSYPVFALSFAAFVQYACERKWHWFFYMVGIYLVILNLFQEEQYQKTILHYFDMNRRYYGRIYFNFHPGPLDMSLLDNQEVLDDVKGYKASTLIKTDTARYIWYKEPAEAEILKCPVPTGAKDTWLRVACDIKANLGYGGTYLQSALIDNDTAKYSRVRLFNPISTDGRSNTYVFDVHVPETFKESTLKLYLSGTDNFDGVVEKVWVVELVK